ncbi:S1 family peptidase [Sphaerisporangium sp. B11E5]|uniref:S1 family peptidase n=1 Tax=Sphaerisporangium sp. B11E5 TaxID=3153563 RepID=UPI00325E50D4
MMRRISFLLITSLLLLSPGVASAGTARLQASPIRVGDSFGTNGRCMVGATVQGGFVTSGICGPVGEVVRTQDGTVVGTVRASTYPSSSRAWVGVTSDWQPLGVLRVPGGSDIPVRGSTPAPVGSSVCGYSGTTGWRCGTVLSRNASVTYPEGTVYGLIMTSVCAEPGSRPGSPLIAGGHLQGILLGASGSCATGGRSYYVPLNEILRGYGLTLLTS